MEAIGNVIEAMAAPSARKRARSLPHADAVSSTWSYWLTALLVIALPIAVMWPVCEHGFTTWDDQETVQENPSLTPVTWHSVKTWWTTTRMDLYVPLTYSAWGAVSLAAWTPGTATTPGYLDPMPFHLANLLMHGLACGVVFALLVLLSDRRRDESFPQAPAPSVPAVAARSAIWPAMAGALLFGLHPVQVEAVAWLSGLKDVLGGTLALLAIWQYAVAAVESRENRGWRWNYAAAIAAFALSMLAKPNELAAMGIALILDVMLLRRSWREAARWLWPWAALAIGCVVVGWIVQPPSGATHNVAVYLRPAVAIASIGFYVSKLVWPAGLAVDYGLTPGVLAQSAWVAAGMVVVAAAVVWGVGRNNAASFSRRAGGAGAMVFLAALLPVLGLVTFDFQAFSNVADHYLYLPMLGVAMLTAWIVQRWSGRGMRISVGVVLAVLAVVSFQQTQVWQNTATLFRRVEAVNPNSAPAAEALSQEAYAQGDWTSAIRWAGRTVDLRPDSALGYVAGARALARAGQPMAAIEQYRRALQLDPYDAGARNDLATLLAQAGQLPQAERQARQALTDDPRYAPAHFNLGTILFRQGNIEEAIAELQSSVALDPRTRQYRLALAMVLQHAGREDEASRVLGGK